MNGCLVDISPSPRKTRGGEKTREGTKKEVKNKGKERKSCTYLTGRFSLKDLSQAIARMRAEGGQKERQTHKNRIIINK